MPKQQDYFAERSFLPITSTGDPAARRSRISPRVSVATSTFPRALVHRRGCDCRRTGRWNTTDRAIGPIVMDCAVSKPGDLRASHNVHASSVSGEDILVNFGRSVGAIYLERRTAGVHDGAPGKNDASEPAALGGNGNCAV